MILFGCLFVSAVAWNLAYMDSLRKLDEGRIPAVFEISEVLATHRDLLGDCGVIFARLSDTTIKKINSEGDRFFVGATQARAHDPGPYRRLTTYADWKPTPVPKKWTSNGSWIVCFDHELVHTVTEAGKRDGAYYTSGDETVLIVVPSLGLLAYSHYD
jgi:hypothetical protein